MPYKEKKVSLKKQGYVKEIVSALLRNKSVAIEYECVLNKNFIKSDTGGSTINKRVGARIDIA